jgi:hypothetical protein
VAVRDVDVNVDNDTVQVNVNVNENALNVNNNDRMGMITGVAKASPIINLYHNNNKYGHKKKKHKASYYYGEEDDHKLPSRCRCSIKDRKKQSTSCKINCIIRCG